MIKQNKIKCPCCDLFTLEEHGTFEICIVCGWEDDGQNDENSEMVLGGPNKDYSLKEARANFKKFNCMYRKGDELFPTNKAYTKQIEKLISKYKKLELNVVDIKLVSDIENLESQLLIIPKNKKIKE